MTIELNPRDNFILDGSAKAWIVAEGAVNVFAARTAADGSFGRKIWLFSVSKGDMLAGFDLRPGATFRIVACAAPLAELEEKPLAFLSGSRLGDERSSMAGLLDRWAENISFALVGHKLPPKSLKFLAPGEAVELEDTFSYGARPGEVLWIKLLEGEAETLGSYTAFFKGHAGRFPVTNRFWFKINSSGEAAPAVSAERTAEFLETSDVASSVAAFHSIVQWLLIEKIENAEADEKARLEKREARDGEAVERALSGFAAIVDGRFGSYSSKTTDGEEFSEACRLVGEACGIQIVIPPAIKKGEKTDDPVAETASLSMVRHRKVLLRDQWWKQDSGPLLGYLENGRPAALIPESATRYRMTVPGEGRSCIVGRAEAAELSGFAHMFYRPLPARPLTIGDIGAYSLKAGILKDAAMMVAAGTALSLINMLTPMATGIAFDSLIPEIERSQMAQMTVILISASLCVMLLQFFRAVATMRLENRVDASLQSAVWDRVLALPATFFRKFSTGDLTMRAMSVNIIRQTISGTFFSSLLTGTFSTLNFLLLFYYDMKLAMVAAGLTLCAALFYGAALLLQYKYSRRSTELEGRIASLVFGVVTGIAKFRVAGAEKRAFGLWAKLFKEKKEIPLYVLDNVMSVFNSVYTLVCSIIFFWFVINYPQHGKIMSSGTFTAFNSAFTTFFAATTELSASMMTVLNVFALYERAKPILETVPEFDEAKEDPGELNGAVEISGVTFRYEGALAPALNDVSISVRPGEFAAIVGPSGSGKSTLIRLLLGFDRPQAGSILYDGQDLSGIDVRAVRRQIGVVLQNGQLMAGTILSNITGSTTLTIEDAWAAAKSAGLEEDIGMMPMGMHTMISEGASTISGGQKQRILIARALVKKPRIIIFDEATSALDNRTQAAVSESLENLHATRIVIAHRLSTIIKADRIFVIENGRLVETGNYEELMKRGGLFSRLAARQIA